MFTPECVRVPRIEMASRLAALVAGEIAAVLEQSESCSLVLPGGSAAELLYAHLPDAPIDWTQVELFWGDERAVALTDADSNYFLAQKLWLSKGNVPEKNIHAMYATGKSLEECSQDYEHLLRARSGARPRLDIAVLGVGPDGHVCSLFPGHALLSEMESLVAPVYDSPKPPAHRLTLTLAALAATSHVIVAGYGTGKARAIAQAVSGDLSLPLARVFDASKRVTLVLDDEAGALL